MEKTKLRGVAAGAGYFSRHHYNAWQRVEQAEIRAIADPDEKKAAEACKIFNIPKYYSNVEEMIEAEKPDFIDIITSPEAHVDICRLAASQNIHVICQKPFGPGINDAKKIVDLAREAGIRLMVHENFRFQPWHREIKKIIDNGDIGSLHYMNFRCRMGDRWAENAYLDRHSDFRGMPKFLIRETGIQFIDLFRYLAGEIEWANAYLNRLNPAIRGEDVAFVNFEFENPILGILDANRYNESASPNSANTFGEFLLEGSKGSIQLAYDGTITIKELGKRVQQHDYAFHDRGFSGDCVYAAQQHFISCLINNEPFETSGQDYLKNLAVEEAIYKSAFTGSPQKVQEVG